MYDVIVVGARCAGASTALLLARQGHRVLLIDRSNFPSDIPHGHFIHSGGPARLRSWGLLDAIIATGCPPITSFTTQWADVRLAASGVTKDGTPLGIAPRRNALDQVLVEAAVSAGAELRDAFTVDAFLTDGDAITGIRGHQRGSDRPITERATVTIGADGRHSHLARFVDAPVHDAYPTLTCFYFSYWSGVSDQGTEVYDLGDKVIFLFPTNDHMTGIFVAWPISEAAAVRADIEGHVMKAIDQVPDLAERIRAGRRETTFRGAIDLPNFLRKPYGKGWALVGDAGCHKDPYMALGCCDAFRDAELLADAIHIGLAGKQPLGEALADYERQRDGATLPDYRFNLQMAQFRGLPPEQLMLRQAIRDNPDAIRQMYLAMEKLTPPELFFNPENLAHLMAPSETPVRAGMQRSQPHLAPGA